MLRDDHTPGVQYLTERRVHEQCIAAQSPLLLSTCTEMVLPRPRTEDHFRMSLSASVRPEERDLTVHFPVPWLGLEG